MEKFKKTCGLGLAICDYDDIFSEFVPGPYSERAYQMTLHCGFGELCKEFKARNSIVLYSIDIKLPWSLINCRGLKTSFP